jgi:hypothetical protein
MELKFAKVTGQVTANAPDGTQLVFEDAVILESKDFDTIVAYIQGLEKQIDGMLEAQAPVTEETTA